MKLYRVECFRACATSAMRDARNGEKLLKKIEKATGIKIEIVTGSEEARILYNNSIESAERVSGNYAYVDVGGGSTEISLLSNGQLVGSCSYNIGTLRKLSGMVPAEVEERLQLDMEEYAKQYPDIKIVGSGGNINRLSRIFHESNKKSKKNVLPVKNLREMYDDMKPLTVAEMMSRYGLKADRADVILPAAEIFLKVSEALNCEEIQVPNISLADCIIDGLYKSMR